MYSVSTKVYKQCYLQVITNYVVCGSVAGRLKYTSRLVPWEGTWVQDVKLQHDSTSVSSLLFFLLWNGQRVVRLHHFNVLCNSILTLFGLPLGGSLARR